MINTTTLLKKGYTHFNLKEYDPLIYLQLEKLNISKKNIHELRLDFKSSDSLNDIFSDILPNYQTQEIAHRWDDTLKLNQYQCSLLFETFDDADTFKQAFLEKSTNYIISQIWFKTPLDIYPDDNFTKLYESIIKKILFDFYDMDDYNSEEQSTETLLTYYNEGCFIENHSDGPSSDRICAILLYLNTKYDISDGGYIRLNSNDNEVVYPYLGNIVILDFTENDINHEVIRCIKNGRMAVINFIKKNPNG